MVCMGAVFTGLQPIVPALRPLCLAHAAVSKPLGGNRPDRPVRSLRAGDENPVAPNAGSAAAVGGGPDRQNRHGISCSRFLSARRSAVDLVVDFAVCSATFVEP